MKPLRLSRSKVDLFIQCPKCFWLNINKKITRPSGPPFSLNVAVDHLFKNEFDQYRGKSVPPRLSMEGINLVPAENLKLSQWRENFKGVTRIYGATNIEFFGAIDDLWVDGDNTHYVVDYKATSKADEVSLDADWQISYKRQVEFYQWLLRGNGLNVSDQAWFVYANGIKDSQPFDDLLKFRTRLIPYQGNASWIEPALNKLIACIESPEAPTASEDCEYCEYVVKRGGKMSSTVIIEYQADSGSIASIRNLFNHPSSIKNMHDACLRSQKWIKKARALDGETKQLLDMAIK